MSKKKCIQKERIMKFWSRVEITALFSCWEWQASKDRYGYGRVWEGERYVLAHRFAWDLTHGKIPDGLCVLHKCDNRPCVNPDHLFLGTRIDNMRDMTNKGRQSRGEKRCSSKLRNGDIPEIRSLLRKGVVQRVIARKYGVSRSAIREIKRGVNWRHY